MTEPTSTTTTSTATRSTGPRTLADLFDADHTDDDAIATFVASLGPHEVHRALATLDLPEVARNAADAGQDPTSAVAGWLEKHAGAEPSADLDRTRRIVRTDRTVPDPAPVRPHRSAVP